MRYIREEWISKRKVTEMIRDLFYSFTVWSYEKWFTILENYDSTNERYSMKVYRRLKGDLDSLLSDFELELAIELFHKKEINFDII